MNYRQTLDYLYSKLPMFTRIGSAAFKKDLKNTLDLCRILDNPQHGFKSIHVAGTNGKGSTSHMLAAVLQEAGYKTGLYTSPHLRDFRERIRINGIMISEQEVMDFVATYQPQFEGIEPSFFEWTVALCFHHFAINKVDVAIIETGLGGRLDSTNVILPQLSVITNIGWDHMDMLGDSLEKIAAEKAGIIKPHIPVIIGERTPETEHVFITKAREENAPIVFSDDEVEINNFRSVPSKSLFDIHFRDQEPLINCTCDLSGIYQQKNITTALCAIKQLKQLGYQISDEHILNALKQVKQLTGLMGRWQVMSEHPLTVCDTGHNVNGIEYVIKQIEQQTYRQLHMVIGMVKDKDISKVLKLLPTHATYYFCNADIPRALPASELALQASALNLNGTTFGSVQEALAAAQKNASSDDMIFIGGSTFVVAEII